MSGYQTKSFRYLVFSAVMAALLITTWGCTVHDRSVDITVRSTGIPDSPMSIKQGINDLKLREPERWVLKSGLTILYLHDDELPLMSGALYVRGGSLFDPPGKEGLAALTGALLREGAPQGTSPDVFDSTLDGLGASIESSFDSEFGTIKFACLEENFPEVFGLFAKIVINPGFDQTRLALSKQLSLEAIARRKDSPEEVVGMMLRTGLYSAESPYAAITTPESVKAISRADIIEFWRRIVRPEHAILVLTGSAPREQVQSMVEREFGTWKQEASTLAAITSIDSYPPPGPEPKPAIYVWTKDLQQTSIALGHFGPPRLTEDQYAISLFNRYFGSGGFESLLFSEIRTRLGLAYSVYGGFFPGSKAGSFEILLGTRNSEVFRAIQAIFSLIERVKQSTPDSSALESAKSGAARSFVFRFSTPSAILQRQASLELLGYPEDFNRTYISKITGVRAGDVQRVAQSRLFAEKLVVAIVGNVSAKDVAEEFGDRFDVFPVTFDFKPQIGAKISARTR